MSCDIPTGILGYAKWGAEASYPSPTISFETNEPSTSATNYFMINTGITTTDEDEKYKTRAIGGGREITAVTNGRYNSTLRLEGELTEAGEDLWILAYGGTETGSGTVTVSAGNQLSSFITEIGYRKPDDSSPNFYRARYHGCKVKTLTINWSKGETPVTWSADIMAQRPKYLSTGVQTPAVATNNPYTGYETVLKIPNTTTVAGIQEGSLTIENNLFAKEDTQSRFKAGLCEGVRDTSFTYKVFFDSINEYEDFFANSGSATTPTTSSTTTANTLNIVMTKGSKITTLTLTGVYYDKVETASDTSGEPIVVDVSGFATTLGNLQYVE